MFGDNIFELDDSTVENKTNLNQIDNILDDLNPEQKEAVITTEGPLLVLSGAGTGKTRVLTTRLAYILSKGLARPWECLTVTFTNKASKEMYERVAANIGAEVESVWLGTFHRICTKILRKHSELINLDSNFTIIDDDDQKRLIKKILEERGIDTSKNPPVAVLGRIQRYKDKGLNPEHVTGDDTYSNISIPSIYMEYQKRLLELNAVDFGDLILHVLNILRKNKNVLEFYQNRFKYIMVDEYQDTNVSQYLLLRLLAQKYKNICCVGDDDQSIYSWRGAEVGNILRFEKEYDNAKIIRLERNYRSTQNILSAASGLIQNNSNRLGKNLKVADNSEANKSNNEKVNIIGVYAGEDEANFTMKEIQNLRLKSAPYSSMAILVRTAAQTREFEEKFISYNIPYKVIGGLKFYERAEIRDALAYIRLLVLSTDNLAFERIINKPTRGFGKATLQNIYDYAYKNRTSFYNAMKEMSKLDMFKGKSKSQSTIFIELYEELKIALKDDNIEHYEIVQHLLEDSGYIKMWENEKSPDAKGRIENLKELIGVIHEKFDNLYQFLEHVSLVMDNESNNIIESVSIMTLHGAKGLEFDNVFLPGWEEGLFPHSKCLDEGGLEALEEERRLAYVGITRAKRKVWILSASSRMLYGQWQNNTPSRFINEIPSEFVNIKNNSGNSYSKSYSYSEYEEEPNYYKKNNNNNWNNSNYFEDKKAKEKAVSVNSEFSINQRVFHQKFGYGRVVTISGDKLEISFEHAGLKKIISSFIEKA